MGGIEDGFGDGFGGAFEDAARVAAERRRGRGAVSNRTGRFEREARVPLGGDGWPGDGEAEAPARREVLLDASRKVIARNRSPDVPFDRSINPYRGCEHGCIYCFARPTHAYLGLSPGLDFETKILVKPGAAEALERELSAPSYRCAPIAMGTNTDPYQPIERERGVTRSVLEVLSRRRHPVTIVTKGAGVTRDLDLLGEMGRAGLARVAVSLTTLDSRLSRRMEPRAAAPEARLRAIAALARAGVPTGVLIAPVVPALTDHEIEPLLEAAARAGAARADWILLRLPGEVRALFEEWLAEAFPDRAARVMARLREARGGRENDPRFGSRMRGEGVWAELIARRFRTAAKRLGLARDWPPLRTDLFRPGRPGGAGEGRQLSLGL